MTDKENIVGPFAEMIADIYEQELMKLCIRKFPKQAIDELRKIGYEVETGDV